MAAFYCVIRFLPSPLAEEFVNVGVLAFKGSEVKLKLLENWTRAEYFAGESLVSIRSLLEETEWPNLGEEVIRKMVTAWSHRSLQLSEPRASLLDVDGLLEEVAPVFLKNQPFSDGRR